MKNRVCIIIFIISIVLSLEVPAVDPYSRTKSFDIQGAFGDVVEIIVDPIPSQTQAYLMGMPFNIEDNQVQYGATESGRLIANWSFISNLPNVSLRIDGEPLAYKNNPSLSTPLDYELRLFYRIGFYNENGDLVDIGNGTPIVYSTNDEVDGNYEGIEETYELFARNIQDGTYIGSLNGTIYFMFTEESSEMLKPADGSRPPYENLGDGRAFFPGGEYVATVTLTLEANE